MMVVGSLIASSVGVNTPLVISLGQTSVALQGILDAICPKLLPLASVIGCYFLVNKGVKPIKIIGLLFIVGIVGGLIGILG